MPLPLRERARRLVDSPAFERTIVTLIVVNAITLGLETSERAMGVAGPVILLIDRLILATFIVELMVRFYVLKFGFFSDP